MSSSQTGDFYTTSETVHYADAVVTCLKALCWA